ncbi:peptidylprolyl isomerase fpr3, partial [Linderina pennispora]
MFCGFWGLKIVPGKTYSQTVDASFRVSNAALGETIGDSGRTSVLLTVDDKSYVLCSLTPGKIEQQSLDISLTGGEEITFESTGKNEIHLTGNFIIEEDDTNEGSESDDDDAIDFSKLSPEQVQELIDGGYINPEDVLQSLGGEDDSDDDYDSEDAEADAQRIIEMDSDDLEVDAEEELEKEVKIK